jgi:polysaccharide biosynthesis protein PslH
MFKILVLSPSIPYPPTDGGRIRIYNLIKYLAEKNEITLIAFYQENDELKHIPVLKEFCKNIYPVLCWSRQIKNLLSKSFFLRAYGVNRLMQDCVNKVVQNQSFDVIQAESLCMSQYLPKIFKGIKVLDAPDVQTIRYKMFADVKKDRLNKIIALLKWRIVRKIERNVGKKVDMILTMSSFDHDVFKKIIKRDCIYITPNGVDANYFKASLNSERFGANLLFIGMMNYLPNIDAMLYFCREIFPIIKRYIKDVKLSIIGKNPPPEILQLEEIDNVEVGGYYVDVRPCYDKCSAFIVPLRSGSGTRLKILEALSMGSPVISTSIGCQGIEVTNGTDIIVIDKPEEFAKEVVGILKNKDLRQKLIKNGRRLIEEKYNWGVIIGNLDKIYKNFYYK